MRWKCYWADGSEVCGGEMVDETPGWGLFLRGISSLDEDDARRRGRGRSRKQAYLKSSDSPSTERGRYVRGWCGGMPTIGCVCWTAVDVDDVHAARRSWCSSDIFQALPPTSQTQTEPRKMAFRQARAKTGRLEHTNGKNQPRVKSLPLTLMLALTFTLEGASRSACCSSRSSSSSSEVAHASTLVHGISPHYPHLTFVS